MVVVEFDDSGEIIVKELVEIPEECEWMIEVIEKEFKK